MLVLAAVLSSGCQTIILGAPKWPTCYLDSEEREKDSDRIEEFYPATYAWIREMDSLCIAWTER